MKKEEPWILTCSQCQKKFLLGVSTLFVPWEKTYSMAQGQQQSYDPRNEIVGKFGAQKFPDLVETTGEYVQLQNELTDEELKYHLNYTTTIRAALLKDPERLWKCYHCGFESNRYPAVSNGLGEKAETGDPESTGIYKEGREISFEEKISDLKLWVSKTSSQKTGLSKAKAKIHVEEAFNLLKSEKPSVFSAIGDMELDVKETILLLDYVENWAYTTGYLTVLTVSKRDVRRSNFGSLKESLAIAYTKTLENESLCILQLHLYSFSLHIIVLTSLVL